MSFRPLRAILLLVISIVAAGVVIVDSPLTAVVPKASAAVPGSAALLGFFSESKKSSAVVDSTLGVGALVKFDVNVTGAGPIKGISVNFSWASAALTFSNSSYGNYVVSG